MGRETGESSVRGLAFAAAPIALVVLGVACGARSDLAGSSSSRSAPDGGDAQTNIACVHERYTDRPGAAYIEFALDGSGSMSDSGKWDAAKRALDSVFDDYLAKHDTTTSLGFLIFGDQNDPTAATGPYPTKLDVPPSFVDAAQHDALRARLDHTGPFGGTPTLAVLDGSYRLLRAYAPAPPTPTRGRRVLVFMSDGAPGGGDEEKTRSLALASSNLTTPPSILTFSIGIGPLPALNLYDYDPEFMSDLAIAGGTRVTPECNPKSPFAKDMCHFQITPSLDRTNEELAADMLKALESVRQRTVDVCAYALDGDFARFDPTQTRLTLWSAGASRDVPEDVVNGWEYDSKSAPRGILLHGQTCNNVNDDATIQVTMSFGCRS